MAGVPPLEHHPLFHWCWRSPLAFEHYRTGAVCDALLFLLPPIYLFKWLQRVLNSSHPLCRLLPAQQQLHSLTSTLPHTPRKLPWLCSPVCPCSLLSCMMALSLLFSASVIHSIHLSTMDSFDTSLRANLFIHISTKLPSHFSLLIVVQLGITLSNFYWIIYSPKSAPE